MEARFRDHGLEDLCFPLQLMHWGGQFLTKQKAVLELQTKHPSGRRAELMLRTWGTNSTQMGAYESLGSFQNPSLQT